jgi:hypothetical protein
MRHTCVSPKEPQVDPKDPVSKPPLVTRLAQQDTGQEKPTQRLANKAARPENTFKKQPPHAKSNDLETNTRPPENPGQQQVRPRSAGFAIGTGYKNSARPITPNQPQTTSLSMREYAKTPKRRQSETRDSRIFLQTKETATNDPGSARKTPTRLPALRPGTPTPRGMEKLEWKGRIVLSVLRKY